MAFNKEEDYHVEATSVSDHATGRNSIGPAAETYHEDGAVLVDIGAKGVESGQAAAVKLARDGHVSRIIKRRKNS